MSNCDLVAARSLIHLAASRLALRAPALRAATVLTRPDGSARWLPCGRHGVLTAVTVGPTDVVTNHCVERGDHLAHHCHDNDLRQFSGGSATTVDPHEQRIPSAGAHRRHEEHVADWRATAPHATLSLELATLEGIRRNAYQRSDLLATHMAEFGQERNQGTGQHRSDARHGGEQSVSVRERRIGHNDLDQALIEHVDIGCEASDAATREPLQHGIFEQSGGILGGAAAVAWPIRAQAQPSTRLPRIGWLVTGSPTSYRFSLAAFRDGLKTLNYIEGQNISIEYRWAEGKIERLPELHPSLRLD